MKSCIVTILCRTAVPFILAVSMLDTAALAGELAGAALPDTLKSGDLTLTLNGLGLRKKSVFKVYVGGLYLESPSKDAGAILASDQGKAIRLQGFVANAKDKAAQKPGRGTMLQVGGKDLGVFDGKGFADAVFSMWLGATPPSEYLRKGMLG